MISIGLKQYLHSVFNSEKSFLKWVNRIISIGKLNLLMIIIPYMEIEYKKSKEFLFIYVKCLRNYSDHYYIYSILVETSYLACGYSLDTILRVFINSNKLLYINRKTSNIICKFEIWYIIRNT